jgi:hypothetical protein
VDNRCSLRKSPRFCCGLMRFRTSTLDLPLGSHLGFAVVCCGVRDGHVDTRLTVTNRIQPWLRFELFPPHVANPHCGSGPMLKLISLFTSLQKEVVCWLVVNLHTSLYV